MAVETYKGPVVRKLEDCDPITGDGIALPVTWLGSSQLNHGNRPVILSFQMNRAELFGIEFY